MAHQTQKGCWRAQFRQHGRIVASKTFPRAATEAEAAEWEMRAKLEYLRRRPAGNGPTLSEFVGSYVKEHAAVHTLPSTVDTKRAVINQHILPVFGRRLISSVRPKDVAAFQANLWRDGDGLAPQTIGNILSTLSQIFRFALIKDVVDINPCAGVMRIKRPKREPTYWSIEERDQFLAYCRKADFRLFQLVALGITTGMRPGELQGLQRSRLDFSDHVVVVDQNWCPRTGKLNHWTKGKLNRVVSVPPPIMAILEDRRSLAPNDFVFESLRFNALGHLRIKPMARKAGVPPIRFHDLRHSFASHCVLKGKHPIEIRDLLGHTQLASTDIYMHLRKDYLKGATDCLVDGASWLIPPSGFPTQRSAAPSSHPCYP